jgi:cell division protein FtsB
MTVPSGLNETEMGTWLFRVGIAVVGFLLAIAVKDAKKSLDLVPALVAKIEAMKDAQDALFRRIEELEKGHR